MSDHGHNLEVEGEHHQVVTRPRWWLIGLGVVLLGMPLLGFAATVFGMISTFESIATSPVEPRPADLAEGVRMSLLLTLAGLMLGAVGAILIVVGLVFRRRAE